MRFENCAISHGCTQKENIVQIRAYFRKIVYFYTLKYVLTALRTTEEKRLDRGQMGGLVTSHEAESKIWRADMIYTQTFHYMRYANR